MLDNASKEMSAMASLSRERPTNKMTCSTVWVRIKDIPRALYTFSIVFRLEDCLNEGPVPCTGVTTR